MSKTEDDHELTGSVDGVPRDVKDGYGARCVAQLEAWVAGTSNHNIVDEECCPDFSCCNTEVVTPKPVRQRFARAVAEDDEKTKMALLGGFLGAALATMKVNAHIVGDGSEGSDEQ